MHNMTEEELNTLDQRMDDAIRAGIRRAKERQRIARSRNRTRTATAVACGLALIACLFTIRISPVFASMLRDIPGFEKFVDMMSRGGDRGLKLAADSDLVQPVGVSDEHDGGKFTVEGIIADQSRMVVFYQLEGDDTSEATSILFGSPEIKDENGRVLPAFIEYNPGETEHKNGRTIVRGTADISLQDGERWPDDATLTIGSARRSDPEGTLPKPDSSAAELDGSKTSPDSEAKQGPSYSVTFPIDRAKFEGMTKEYPVGQTITAEGQRIVFDRVVVSPLRIALYLSYPEDNTKQVFDAGDIHLVDENGEVWNNTLGTSTEDGQSVLYFESNYFHRPKHMTIEGEWFRALDKSKLQVTIDTEKGQILQAPDERLKVVGVDRYDTYSVLKLVLTDVPDTDHMGYSILDTTFQDASGKEYESGGGPSQFVSTYYIGSEPGNRYMNYQLRDYAYKQPLTFEITQYPAYIRAPYQVRIW